MTGLWPASMRLREAGSSPAGRTALTRPPTTAIQPSSQPDSVKMRLERSSKSHGLVPGDVSSGSVHRVMALESAASGATIQRDTAPARPLSLPDDSRKLWVIRAISVVVVFGLWQFIGGRINPIFLSQPSKIVMAL